VLSALPLLNQRASNLVWSMVVAVSARLVAKSDKSRTKPFKFPVSAFNLSTFGTFLLTLGLEPCSDCVGV
jgi:hypothetical protein